MFQTFIGITALAALLSILNKKVLKLPDTIGIMILAILLSLAISSLTFLESNPVSELCLLIDEIDFRVVLFEFLLGFLLFAGAIHVDIKQIIEEGFPIILYATLGVLISTFLVGTLFYFTAGALGLPISYTFSLVFGALISPTDPIAVLSLLKKAGVSEVMEIKIVGESLFNDGVGIVVFLTLLSLATMMDANIQITHVMQEFATDVGGGLLLGAILGYTGHRLLLSFKDDTVLAVHITLAIVMGGYSLAAFLHISGALAMVISGLIIGKGLHHQYASSDHRESVAEFWKVIDEILNSILFVLIGLEMTTLTYEHTPLILGLIAIIIVVFSRYISLWLANLLLNKSHQNSNKELGIITWAGLRGGISIALVLNLPEGELRDMLLLVTYVIVVFSIIVQGLSIHRVVDILNRTQS